MFYFFRIGVNPMNFGGLTTTEFSDRLSMVVVLIIGLGIGTLILEAGLYWFFSKVLKTTHALAFTLLAPAVIALTLFTVYPLFYNIQLAFSDLRLKTIPCYTPPDTSTAPCPLGQIDAGVRAQVTLDNLVLHTEPGDDAPTTGQVTNGATITVIQQGKVAAPAASNSGSAAGTGSSGGIDLGGAALPG